MTESPASILPMRSIEGQERARSLLDAAIVADAWPNAWLFTGPAGVGKATAAIAVAAAANCAETGGDAGGGLFGGEAKPRSSDACGRCASCRKIAAGNHPDVRVVRVPPEKRLIPIEDVRLAIGELAFRPYEGRRRVVIVDGAEALTPQASNALLKTLEEPPAHSTWILVSTSPAKLLPTILSRCRIVRFGALPADVAARIISRETGASTEEARTLATILSGSVGRALSPEAERFSRESRTQVIDEAFDAATLGGGKILDVAEAWDKRAKDETLPVPAALELLSIWVRDIAVWQADGSSERLLHVDLADRTAKAGRRTSPAGVARTFDAVRRCVNDLTGNVNAKLALETMFLAMRSELG